jgi:hypothetical protein
MAAPLVEW